MRGLAQGFAALLILLAGVAGAERALGEIPHHDISIRLDPQSRAIVVTDQVTVRGEQDLVFDLAAWLEISEALLDGMPIEPMRRGNRVELAVPNPGPSDLSVRFEGEMPALPPPAARGGWPGAAAGKEGSVLTAGSGWLAIFGDAWMTYRLTVEVPEANRAVATGRLVDEVLERGVYRASFESEAAGEPPSIFVGPYRIAERRAGDLRLRAYFHSELVPLADDYLASAAGYIERYSKLIGAYPYSDFHIVSAPFGVGLGFVNLTYVGRRVLPLPFMRGRSLAHEVLHNWWGNGVGIDYATGNWAEGLTSYMADYALARDRGTAAQEMRLGWLKNFAALPAERDKPVRSFVSKQHDAAQVIGYDKAAFVFLMLEAELGEPTFRAGLGRFWERHRFRLAGWDDLRRAFEEVSGLDLAWFFDQWLTRTGAPRLELADARRGSVGGNSVTFTLRQTAPPYRLRLPVLVETLSGNVRHEVVFENGETRFELAARASVTGVRIDPELEVFRALLPGEAPPIIRDLTLSERTSVVVASKGSGIEEMAATLGARLLQRRVELRDRDEGIAPGTPVIAIGLESDIAALRAEQGPFSRDHDLRNLLSNKGTLRAWTERRQDLTSEGTPWLFVAAQSADALGAALRPLPHYRSRSFVVFDGSKAVQRGHWRMHASPLSHRFER